MMDMIRNLQSQLQPLVLTALVALFAIVCHECAHGWVSCKLGDPTAKNAGRLTLNPLKHIDPVGMLCMAVFRIGWAKPVPINPYYYRDRKKGILYVSLAGPVMNAILAFVSLLTEGLLIKFAPSNHIRLIFLQLCYYSAVINIGLCLFNLVPIPPLDGSKVVGALWPKAGAFYWKHQKYWRWILLICILTGLLSKPLGMLNHILLNGMWRLVRLILQI
jgi:Zn-dependent protease